MRQKTWSEAVQAAFISGAIAGAATAVAVAIAGKRESGSAAAPINATSHVVHGSQAASVTDADIPHTALGFLINTGAAVFWATLYEKAFGAAAERGDIAQAWFGGKSVAGLAYMTDYHAVPKRLTPGWEERVSNRSLMSVYAALALSLPVRGLLQSRFWRRPELRRAVRGSITNIRQIAARAALLSGSASLARRI